MTPATISGHDYLFIEVPNDVGVDIIHYTQNILTMFKYGRLVDTIDLPPYDWWELIDREDAEALILSQGMKPETTVVCIKK